MPDPDELARAASDAVDAYCAANPAPAWPVLPDSVPADETAPTWTPRPAWSMRQIAEALRQGRLTVTYVAAVDVDAWHDALTDRQRQAIERGAAIVAEAIGISDEWMRGAIVRHLARNGNGGAEHR